jgi:ubiquinone/menaquinone biosynthesis C-methylase UbiE
MVQNKWWQDNVSKDPETFKSWTGDDMADDRVLIRSKIIGQYRSILDCACGFAKDAHHYTGNSVVYRGIDSTDYLVQDCQGRGLDVVKGSIEDIPFTNREFEVVHARHIFEHLEHYKTALKEMIRVASRLVVVSFFIPLADKEVLGKDPNLQEQVYLNTYSKAKLLQYLKHFNRVLNVEITPDNKVLFITLK